MSKLKRRILAVYVLLFMHARYSLILISVCSLIQYIYQGDGAIINFVGALLIYATLFAFINTAGVIVDATVTKMLRDNKVSYIDNTHCGDFDKSHPSTKHFIINSKQYKVVCSRIHPFIDAKTIFKRRVLLVWLLKS